MTSFPVDGTPAEAPPPGVAAPALSGGDLLLWSALPDLTLNIAQTAALCGVSVRQLGYWTKQGYVAASGAGARRLYGPDSLRRILAIRQAMQNGLSLRQALHALTDAPPPGPAAPPPADAAAPPPPTDAAAAGSDDLAAVTADLVSLFDQDRHVYDSVTGLAVKLGRRTDHVRRAAEALAAQGTLTRFHAGGEAAYARTRGRFA